MYRQAKRRNHLYGLLVVKNGQLVAEAYYNEGGIDEAGTRQPVTKSYTSALVGLAIKRGCLSLDDKMMDFFPEAHDDIVDDRKLDITVEQMLKMRAGSPGRRARKVRRGSRRCGRGTTSTSSPRCR